MKKALSFLLVSVMLLCMIPTTAFAASEINIVTVGEILVPLDGFKPDLSGSPGHPAKYSVKKIDWSEYDADMEWQRDLEANDTFVKGNYYYVFVTLEAKDGYVFSNNVTANVNGSTANKYAPKDNGKTIQIYYCFDICKKNIERVDLSIVTPIVGKTPTFAKVNTDEYESKNTSGVSNQTNGVSCTNQSSGVNLTVSNPFKENTKYTVKYYLTAKENYWFNGTKYYINGQRVDLISSNAGMTEVVVGLADLVPGDGKTAINSVELTVTAPKDGEKPTYNKIDGTGYYSDNGINGSTTKIYKNGIAWYKSASSYIGPGTTETFTGGTEYTVKIALTPKDGYKFGTSVTAKINGKIASVEAFDDGSINVSVALTAAQKDHTHTPSEWRTTGIYHYKACTTCGDFLEQEDHKGGVATCSEKGTCTVCEYAYIEENENHNPDTSKWTACGNLYHAHLCKDCGAHAITEDHKAGPATTETEPQKCTVCGYIITPAKNHTHSLTKIAKVDATCIKPGNVEHYTCNGCSDVFADSEGKTKLTETVIAPLGHKASDDWAYDENYHWRTCTVCNEALAETKMSHEIENGKCTTCNYDGTLPEATEPDNSEATGNTPIDKQNEKNENGFLIWIILGTALVIAVGAVVAVIVNKKKK